VQEALRVLGQPGEVDMAAPEFQSDHVHGLPEGGATRAVRDGNLGFDPRAHLINLRDGRLSAEGAISTSEKDLKAIFQTHLPAALAEAAEAGRPLRVMFYAHGGLTSEKGALETALRCIPWWLANGVYPIFFIWETGLLETLGQMLQRKTNDLWGRVTGLFGRRGLGDFIADHTSDPAVEILARSIGGVAIWGGMKDSAERASAANTGGAWLAAQALKGFLKTAGNHPIELHAIGHSAGSIFHAHFIEAVRQALGAAGPSFTSLHHLAPAIRVDLFKKKIRPLLGKGKGIDHLTVYTMTDAKERADTCMNVYRKSLLYLIHFGLEPERRCPILGMQVALRGDSELKALFEPAVRRERARLQSRREASAGRRRRLRLREWRAASAGESFARALDLPAARQSLAALPEARFCKRWLGGFPGGAQRLIRTFHGCKKDTPVEDRKDDRDSRCPSRGNVRGRAQNTGQEHHRPGA
jgi:hypothetical protein